MKRLLLLVFLLGLVSKEASAQTFGADSNIGDALDFVTVCAGLPKGQYDPGAQIRNQKLEVAVTIDGCNTPQKFKAAMQKILPESYEAYLDLSGSLHIKSGFTTPTPQDKDIQASPSPRGYHGGMGIGGNQRRQFEAELSTVYPDHPLHYPVSDYNNGVLPNMYTVPPVWSPSLGIPQAEWILARNRMPSYPSIPAPYPGYYPLNAGYGAGYGFGANLGYNPWLKGCLTGPHGYIKFKYDGREAERKLWQVYLNGEIVGSLDQGDSFFNHLDVCAGHNEVLIEKVGIGRMQRPYSVRPFTLTEITVGDFLLPKKGESK